MNKEIIGIIGTGTMGSGIAQMFAANGFQTLLWDTNSSFIDKGIEAINKRLNKSIDKGKLTGAEAESILSRINKADSLNEFTTVDFVIEAVIEDYDIKVDIYRKLEQIISLNTIIGTNTSSLSVTDLSNNLVAAERFLGVHFFNPPTKLELVEIVSTPVVSSETIRTVRDILARCGKNLVSVNDSPGFIVNRLLLPFINEAAKLLDTGVAKAEDIDTAMYFGTLHPAGPLQVADLIGLDICKDILEKLSDSLSEPTYKPAKSIMNLVKAGKLGRKTGQGFYTY